MGRLFKIFRLYALRRQAEADHPLYVRDERWLPPERPFHWSGAPPDLLFTTRNEAERGVVEIPSRMRLHEAVFVAFGWIFGLVAFAGMISRLLRWEMLGLVILGLFFVVPFCLVLLRLGEKAIRIERTRREVVFTVRWGFFLARRVHFRAGAAPVFTGRLQSCATMDNFQRQPTYRIFVRKEGRPFFRRTFTVDCNQTEGSWLVTELQDWRDRLR
jgi:hypothetical protein